MQSTLRDTRAPVAAGGDKALHVAIILDGNGRWAAARGLPRSAGHRAGARAVRQTVEAAGRQGIDVLTLFAFSADNWRRPREEVAALMTLLRRYLLGETSRCLENGVRINIIGRRDRFDPSLVTAIEAAESATASGHRLLLRIAVDYSARHAIASAAADLAAAAPQGSVDQDAVDRAIARASHSVPGVPPVDFLIRTSGELRLSDFLLWESAYAELFFTPTLWPDFGPSDLEAALADFNQRERRFGRLPQTDPRLRAVAGEGA